MAARILNISLDSLGGRGGFLLVTILLHVAAAAALLSAQTPVRQVAEPTPIEASIVDVPVASDDLPPPFAPPPMDLVYSVEPPPNLVIETDAISVAELPPPPMNARPSAAFTAPPVVESVEYVRAPAPVYPSESNRRRERGTVLLRVLVDALGRPARIDVEQSSGHPRLDDAARDAVRRALFRPHEIDGIAQPAQVLIPIEFARRAT